MESYNQIRKNYRRYKDAIKTNESEIDRSIKKIKELEIEIKEYTDEIQNKESEINRIRETIKDLEIEKKEYIFMKSMYSGEIQDRQKTRRQETKTYDIIDINDADRKWYDDLLSNVEDVKTDAGLKRKKKSRSKRKRLKRKYNKKFT